jgi:creatinine amidohydrolase
MTELGRSTWPDVPASGSTLLVPLGATEQHGPHLPIDTDTRIATAWCQAAASGRDGVLVAPALPYGSSGEHAAFPGTLSIGTEVLTSVLVELVRSAVPPHGRVVLVNGHGGNHLAVTAAIEVARAEGRAVEAVWPRLPGDAHAGRTETSLMLAIDADVVRLDLAVAGTTTPIRELMDDLIRDGVRPHSPSGVLGDPAGASAEEGRRLLAVLVEQLAAVLDSPPNPSL